MGCMKKHLVEGGIVILDDAKRSVARFENLHELLLKDQNTMTRLIPGYTR